MGQNNVAKTQHLRQQMYVPELGKTHLQVHPLVHWASKGPAAFAQSSVCRSWYCLCVHSLRDVSQGLLQSKIFSTQNCTQLLPVGTR